MNFELNSIKDQCAEVLVWLKDLDPDKTAISPDGGWSVKEIIGHLIDSAQNNQQRFIRLAADELKEFPGYDQVHFARLQAWQDYPWNELVMAWYTGMQLLVNVIEHLPEEAMQNCWQIDGQSLSLEYLIEDFFSHMDHHLNRAREQYTDQQ